MIAFFNERGQVSFPSCLANPLDSIPVLGLHRIKLRLARNTHPNQPLAHLAHTVELGLPPQPLGGLVSLLTSGSGVALRLCEICDVDQRWNVVPPRCPDGRLIRCQQRPIVPAGDLVQIEAALAVIVEAIVPFEPLEDGVDVLLHHLELVGDRDAVPVIVDGDDGGGLQHTNGVDSLPEHALGRGSIAYCGKGHLITVVREPLGILEVLQLAIDHGGIRQPHRARHLRARWRDISGRVVALGLILPGAVRIDETRGKVRVHAPAAGTRLGIQIGVRIELGEMLLESRDAQHVHPGLIAVVARSPVPLSENPGNGDIDNFLATPEDAELRLAA